MTQPRGVAFQTDRQAKQLVANNSRRGVVLQANNQEIVDSLTRFAQNAGVKLQVITSAAKIVGEGDQITHTTTGLTGSEVGAAAISPSGSMPLVTVQAAAMRGAKAEQQYSNNPPLRNATFEKIITDTTEALQPHPGAEAMARKAVKAGSLAMKASEGRNKLEYRQIAQLSLRKALGL